MTFVCVFIGIGGWIKYEINTVTQLRLIGLVLNTIVAIFIPFVKFIRGEIRYNVHT